MIDTIIVDDEYIIRERLKKCINWEDLGYSIVGDCEDGLQAIKLIDLARPKLAIVDINMPGMDGLGLAEYISKNFLNVYVIILTGYEDFNYVRDALKNGVFRYLLKPINKEEFNEVLIELREIIMREDVLYKESMMKKRKLKVAEEHYKSQELLAFLTNNTNSLSSDIIKHFRFEDSKAKLSYAVAVISICNFDKIEQSLDDKNLWLYGLENILEEFSKDRFKLMCTSHFDGYLIACLCCKSQMTHSQVIMEFLEKYIDIVHQLMPFKITIGMSSIGNDINDMPYSYKEAKLALIKRLILGSGKVIQFKDTVYQNTSAIDSNMVNELIMNIRIGDLQKVENILTKAIRCLKTSPSWYTSLHNVVSMVMISTEIICNENNIQFYSIWVQGVTSLDLIYEFENLEELLVFLIEKLSLLMSTIKNIGGKRTSDIITQVIKYIDNHYIDTHLTLKTICKHIPANTSYISNQFKKETGININVYITSKRMEEAQRLKTEGKLSVEEIAYRVGYKDQYYFSKCFKKYFGIAPTRTMS